MKRLARSRRAPWLVLVLVVACAAAAVAVAAPGGQPADLTFTPKHATDFTNIDVGRAWAKNYYGAPTAVAGSGSAATWDAPLSQTSNYAKEARSVAKAADDFLNAHGVNALAIKEIGRRREHALTRQSSARVVRHVDHLSQHSSGA